MAANGDRPLPRHKQTTPTRIVSGPGNAPGSRMHRATGKLSGGMVHPAKTTPTSITSGPAHAPYQARLDNRQRMAADKPSSRRIAGASFTASSCHRLSRTEPLMPRAGPSAG
jgi:hypothetical protein